MDGGLWRWSDNAAVTFNRDETAVPSTGNDYVNLPSITCLNLPPPDLSHSTHLAAQDEGYEDFRALFTNLLDSDSASPQFELTKRMQAVAGPVMSRLSDAASKLIQ